MLEGIPCKGRRIEFKFFNPPGFDLVNISQATSLFEK